MPNLDGGTITAITDQTTAIKSAVDAIATALPLLEAACEAARVELKTLEQAGTPPLNSSNMKVQAFVERAGYDAFLRAITEYAVFKGLRELFATIDRCPGSSKDAAVTNLSTSATTMLDPWTA
jgi:hypothetical protein